MPPPRRTKRFNMQPWILVLIIGLLLAIATMAFIFTYTGCMKTSVVDNQRSLLRFSTVVYTPGDRTPLATYRRSQWSEASHWPVGWGELTAVGRRQQQALGGWLRRRYLGRLVPRRYSDVHIRVQASGSNRTLQSAGANLAGLFPDGGFGALNETVVKRRPTVATVPDTKCPARRQWQRLAAEEFDAPLMEKHGNLTAFLEYQSGERMERLADVGRLYDALWIERLNGRAMPAWTGGGVFPGEEFAGLAAKALEVQTIGVELRRLRVGGLLREIMERMEAKSQFTLMPDRTLWMYSEERETLVELMAALGVHKTHIPPYAAALIFEMHFVHGEPHVQLLYQNQTAAAGHKLGEPHLIYLPGCGTMCPLAQMFRVYASVLPEHSAEEDCELLVAPLPVERNNGGVGGVWAELLLRIVLLALLTSFV